MTSSLHCRAVVIGGGPAGLMAAESLCRAGFAVDLFDGKGSVGRKFLLAGKGGLNLTHSEPAERFQMRYGARAADVGRWLAEFDADALRAWAAALGVATFVGSSGRVFPADLKAAPLLRGWLRRLRAMGVSFHVQHRWLGWDAEGALRFNVADAEIAITADVVVLALGGGSWAKLGSDGAWVEWLRARHIDVADLKPANCGFELAWSAHFRERYAGQPLKPVAMSFVDALGQPHLQRGELLVTEHGIEGSLAYALSTPLRDTLAAQGSVEITLDLDPERDLAALTRALAKPAGRHTQTEHLRRSAGLSGVRAGLLREAHGVRLPTDPHLLATAIKATPLRLTATRPMDEAISTAGGVRLEALSPDLMLTHLPGVFCCGEMLDWEAPTGGYLLTACMASGRVAGRAAAAWLTHRP